MSTKETFEPLNPKQERFCQEYVKDSNGAQAAIRAGYSKKTANVQGSQLLAKLNIQSRVKELQAQASEACKITLIEHIETLKRLRDKAESEAKYKDAISAEVHIGKVSGLYTETHEVKGNITVVCNILNQVDGKSAGLPNG